MATGISASDPTPDHETETSTSRSVEEQRLDLRRIVKRLKQLRDELDSVNDRARPGGRSASG